MLALTSTLVLVLFDEARAVDVAVEVPDDVSVSDGTVVVSINIAIPAGQLVPIESLEAMIEETNGAVYNSPTLVATGTCMGAGGCSNPDTTGSTIPLAITAIEADTNNPGETAGYLDVGNGIVADDISELAGYGYGYGYGYGNSNGDPMQFTVTIDVAELGGGHYWVTFIIHTRSATIGDISSSEAYLRVTGAPSNPGQGNAGAPPANPASGAPPPGIGIAPGIVEHRADGSTIAETTIPPGLDNPAIDLTSVDPRLETLTLDPAAAPPGAIVSVVVRDSPPADLPTLPGDFAPGTIFLEISIELPDGAPEPAEGAEAPRAQIAFRLPEGEMDGRNAQTVTLLHFTGGRWVAEETERVFTVGNVNVYVSSFRGFSPFAVVFDDEAPEVSILGPANGRTVGVRPLVAATLADNRGIDVSKTTLTIDSQKVAAQVSENTIRFTPSVPLTPGEHTATVRAVDESGLETVARTTFTVRPGGDPTAPVVTITSPADGAFVTTARPTFTATMSDDKGIDVRSVVAILDGIPVPVKASATGLSFAPDADLADGVHELAVSADDANGNGGFAIALFTVDTQAPVISLRDVSDGGERLKISATIAGEAVSRVTFTLDGKEVGTISKSGNVYTLDEPIGVGQHTVVVSATDEAGNTESTTYSFESIEQTSVDVPEESSKGTPGFGLVLGVLALAGCALVMRRK